MDRTLRDPSRRLQACFSGRIRLTTLVFAVPYERPNGLAANIPSNATRLLSCGCVLSSDTVDRKLVLVWVGGRLPMICDYSGLAAGLVFICG